MIEHEPVPDYAAQCVRCRREFTAANPKVQRALIDTEPTPIHCNLCANCVQRERREIRAAFAKRGVAV